jgi:hypothetical protein
MTQQPHREQPEEFDPFAGPFEQARMAHRNRREKIIQEIMANRRGEFRVPTWMLAVALVVMIVGICGVLLLA